MYFRNEVRSSGVDARKLKASVKTLLAAVGETASSISVTLVTDKTIRALNRDHRGKDAATDVLSFPLAENDTFEGVERMLGDIFISVDTARRQAAEYDAPLRREIERLLIHGLLHVLGHDHIQPDDRVVMEAEERRLAGAINMPWPYEDEA